MLPIFTHTVRSLRSSLSSLFSHDHRVTRYPLLSLPLPVTVVRSSRSQSTSSTLASLVGGISHGLRSLMSSLEWSGLWFPLSSPVSRVRVSSPLVSSTGFSMRFQVSTHTVPGHRHWNHRPVLLGPQCSSYDIRSSLCFPSINSLRVQCPRPRPSGHSVRYLSHKNLQFSPEYLVHPL